MTNKNEKNLKVLGEKSVKISKEKCKFIINGKQSDIHENIKYDEYDINKNDDILKIFSLKLTFIFKLF